MRGFRTSSAAQAQDYYKVLGLSKNATEQEIKKAYYKLAKQYHPDTNKDNPDAAAKFQEVSKAYETLRDPEKRQIYDQIGRERMEQMESEGGMGAGAGPFGGGQPFNAEEVFSHFMRSDPFFNMFFRQQMVMNSTIELTLEEAVQGARRDIPISIPGQKPTTVRVDIPAGIDSGQTIQIPVSAGRQGPHMTMLMNVQVLPHKVFQREGPHLHMHAFVSLVDALLGSTITVPTLYGVRSLKVPQCSLQGDTLVLSGMGVPDPRGFGRGDQYVHLKVKKPVGGLNERQRHLLVEFDREEQDKTKARKAAGGQQQQQYKQAPRQPSSPPQPQQPPTQQQQPDAGQSATQQQSQQQQQPKQQSEGGGLQQQEAAAETDSEEEGSGPDGEPGKKRKKKKGGLWGRLFNGK